MAEATSPTIRTFQVFPDIPAVLEPLMELAHNLWWVWHPDAVELFRRLDRKLWEDVYHNPVKMLGAIPQAKLAVAAKDEGYIAHMKRVCDAFKANLADQGWFQQTHVDKLKMLVAYFSAEFGLHESLPIYSGGLGVLAGDHLEKRQRARRCRWSASGCSTATAISSNTSRPTAGSRRLIPSWISTTCRSSR